MKQIVKESKQDVLLLFAAKDTEHNQAVILKDLLDNQQSLRIGSQLNNMKPKKEVPITGTSFFYIIAC